MTMGEIARACFWTVRGSWEGVAWENTSTGRRCKHYSESIQPGLEPGSSLNEARGLTTIYSCSPLKDNIF